MKRITKNELDELELKLRIVNRKYLMLKLQTKSLSKERQALQRRINYYNKKEDLKRIRNEK